jgi:putative PEP-CTERM system TPR-repeat lipoprotein
MALATAVLVSTAPPTAHAADPAMPAKEAAPAKPNDAGANLRQRETELRNTLRTNPNDAAAHFQLGRVYLDQGNWREAVTEFRSAQRSGANNDDLDAQLAWALYLSNDTSRLFREIKPGDRKPAAESLVRMSLGFASLLAQNIDDADRLLRDAVRLDPDSWRAHLGLARLLILERKLPEARQQLDEARRIAPNESGLTRISGELLRAEGDTQGAIDAFTKVLDARPSVPALAGRIEALISEDKLSEAQRDLRQARKISRHSQIGFLAALVLAREERLVEADQALTNASSAFERMPIAYYLAGVVKYRRGLFETAENNLAKFQAKQPHASGPARLRAEIALRRKDAAAAIKLLEPIVKENPADRAAVTDLARAYLANGNPDQVLKLFHDVSAPPPETVPHPDAAPLLMIYGDALGDLVEIEKVLMPKTPGVAVVAAALRQGNLDKAATVAEALAGSRASDPAIQNSLGSVRLAQKRLPDAEASFRRALEQDRDFTPAALNLVQVLVDQNRSEEAKVLLQDIVKRSQ